MSKHTDEHLKLVQKVVEVADRINIKLCVTLLQYSVDKPESYFAQVRLFASKKEDQKFPQIVYVNCKLEISTYLIDVMKSVYKEVITNQPVCNVL